MRIVATASPPDVRKRLALPSKSFLISGAPPLGIAPKRIKSQQTAGHSHRLTSGGRAVATTGVLIPSAYCETEPVLYFAYVRCRTEG